MKLEYISTCIDTIRDDMCKKVREFSNQSGICRWLGSRVIVIPTTAAIDILLETLNYPARTAENLVSIPLNFFGACCFEDCSVKQSFYCIEDTFGYSAKWSVAVILSPFKWAYLVAISIYDPANLVPLDKKE